MSYEVILSKRAVKDAQKLKSANLSKNAKELLEIIKQDPFQSPPRFKKLVGNMSGIYSRRINAQHRLTYTVDQEQKIVHVLRMWTHYE